MGLFTEHDETNIVWKNLTKDTKIPIGMHAIICMKSKLKGENVVAIKVNDRNVNLFYDLGYTHYTEINLPNEG